MSYETGKHFFPFLLGCIYNITIYKLYVDGKHIYYICFML